MKKNKFLSILSSAVITAFSIMPFSSSAILTLPKNVGTFDDLIESIDTETNFVKRTDEYVYVVSEEKPNSATVYRECENVICVTVKKGTELEKDDVTDNGFGSLVNINDNVYLLGDSILHNDETKAKIVDELKTRENVVSVDYCNTLAESQGLLYCVYIKSNLTDDEIKDRYLIEAGNSTKDDARFFAYANAKEQKFNSYDLIRTIQNDSDIDSADFSFIVNSSNSMPNKQGKVTENLYTAPIKGDVNADGDIDVADVIAITAFVGNSENNKFNSEQKMINGDVHNSGDGLTANDALLIQQYISGDISNLE